MAAAPISLADYARTRRTPSGRDLAAADPRVQEFELARRASSGDADAQSVLIRRVMGRVRCVARALCRRSSDADDAAQIALVQIIRGAHTYRGEAPLEAWAKRIAVRVVLRHLARERRISGPLRDADAQPLADVPRREAGEALPAELRDYLSRLPEAQAQALVLHHALGYSLAEVADMTDVSVNTVKGRLRLGTQSLRKHVRRELAIGTGKKHTQ